jgi:hypothetical protein
VTGVAAQAISIGRIAFSNKGSATSGAVLLTVADGATTIWENTYTVVNGNGTSVPDLVGLKITTANNLVVTLAAGAANSQWILVVPFTQQ